VRLTYKGPATIKNDISARYEAEVEVSSYDTMAAILEHLGYHPHLGYEKYRTSYELEGAEIVLDEMPYGHFVEIEGEVAVIESLVEKLELRDAPRFGASYAGLFDTVRRNMSLDFSDLSFENFAGIEVPEWAFLEIDAL
jgi:adenylate cyclase class 2